MKASEFKKLIRKEVKGALSEVYTGNLETRVIDLYANDGIRTQYDDSMIQKFGQDVVDKAVEMAPKLLAYETKLKGIIQQLEKSPEVEMLTKILQAGPGIRGFATSPLGALVNKHTQ